MNKTMSITIDNKIIEFTNERNLLEVIRKANIELPTFCYHSELSIYGACRLCMVDVQGRGLCPACSTLPENGMKIKTNTSEIRELRKIVVELLLANHNQACPTCSKSNSCQLQELARKLGIEKVRFKNVYNSVAVDKSSVSIIRDPNKCILCGDCVRMCKDIQGVGAIDFAYRGAKSCVMPSYGKNLDDVECVNCGQCARVCPTGALTPRSELDEVWEDVNNPNKMVIAQIAPAVRVALGELFGLEPGTTTTGQIISALRQIGFDKVFDTSFTADLTVIEEGNEFINRFTKKEKMPLFTSCCPAWVKFAEQYYPSLLSNLSSCKSPQQMFGSVAKKYYKDAVVVSIMPCTAKKFEAKRKEFYIDGKPDVDHVLTTQELGRMIEAAGIKFNKLPLDSFDLPLGFKTGAGVIFGNTGGVTEAVLRYASEKITGIKQDKYEYNSTRGTEGVREITAQLGDVSLKIAIVHGLNNAKKLAEAVMKGNVQYDFIEVMACPGGCVGGAGQPVYSDPEVRIKRKNGLYDNDKMLQLHKAQDNPYICELYAKNEHINLHTKYNSKKRIKEDDSVVTDKLKVRVCVGTSCYIRGSQSLLVSLIQYIKEQNYDNFIDINASFCLEKCTKGPTVFIGDKVLEKCTFEKAVEVIDEYCKNKQGKM